MKLHCLRHGETESNVASRYSGAGEDPLTEAQRERFRAIRFDATRFGAVYCSPFRRCTETAQSLGLGSWTTEPRLAERDFGVFEGLTPAQCRERYPEEFARFLRFDADYQIPGGESRRQNHVRIESWIESLTGDQSVLAITHGGTIDFLYRRGSDLPLHGGTIHSGDNSAISTFLIRWPHIEVVSFNIALPA